MERVLVVEDSQQSQLIIKAALGGKFEVVCANSIAEALSRIERITFDLVLLDVSLPDGDGFQFCSQLKNMEVMADVPVIFLTGKSSPGEKIMGFALGADDYVVKPFDPGELRARVDARLNHQRKQKIKTQIQTKGNVQINISQQKAYLLNQGERSDMNLTPVEFKLLAHFMRHEEHVLSRGQLLEAVTGEQVYVLDRTIDKHICSLRDKLHPHGDYIKTVFRTGYSFTTQIEKKGTIAGSNSASGSASAPNDNT
ncbi:MAG: response regulator transcription factor [Methylotenera sp.]|nr:response regulator transcription factor [Oligoflexia bacterium]